MKICKAEDCDKKVLAKELCRKHYYRAYRRVDGSYHNTKRTESYGLTVLERYEHLIDRSGGEHACHSWTGAKDCGYAVFWNGEYTSGGSSKVVTAHRWGYINIIEELMPDEVVRHLCHNKICQNPKHWAKGTQKDNSQDMLDAGLYVHYKSKPKLTDEDVTLIRREYEFGGITKRQLAKKFNITETYVAEIISRRVR